MVEQVGGGEALGAEAALVDREVARLEPHPGDLRGQRHAALQGAVGAMRIGRGHTQNARRPLFTGETAAVATAYGKPYKRPAPVVRSADS
jgi:hypothetical protein